MHEDKGKQLELKKHINTIHCSNNLSLVQRKLFNALLYHAYSNLPTQWEFSIPIGELCLLIGYNSHDYDKLKKSLIELISIVIEWNVVEYSSNKHNDKWKASSILSAVTLERGICRYEYSSALRELLYRPEFYGRICLVTQSKFKSSYGLALYENCVRYRSIPQTPWFSLQTFRKLMGVTEEKYLVFKDFKKRVIDIAVSEVNEHSNIFIQLEIRKERKQVAGIRFKIYEKVKKIVSPRTTDNELVNKLVNDFKLSPELINEILDKYSQEYIQEKINLILSSKSFKEGKIQVLAGYLLNALKNDYKVSPSIIELTSIKQKNVDERLKKEAELKHKLEKIEPKYNQYLITATKKLIASITEEECNNLMDKFLAYATFKQDLVVLFTYKKSGLQEDFMKLAFAAFMRDKKLYQRIFITIEEFLIQVEKK